MANGKSGVTTEFGAETNTVPIAWHGINLHGCNLAG